MKRFFLITIAAVAVLLNACKQDNTPVVQITEIINEGAQQYADVRNGKVSFDSIAASGELFQTPNGNIFENERIYAIIHENPKYTLTDEDKEMLIKALDGFRCEGDGIEDIGSNMVAMHGTTTVQSSKQLRDLFAHGH